MQEQDGWSSGIAVFGDVERDSVVVDLHERNRNAREGRRAMSVGLRPPERGIRMAKGKKTKKDKGGDGTQLIASYKRAYRDYDILDTFEAGMVLTGSTNSMMHTLAAATLH